jgi:hypothetical protein
MSFSVFTHSEGLAMINRALAVANGQQVVSLLLCTLPLAERMLLYNVAMTALVMLPSISATRIP